MGSANFTNGVFHLINPFGSLHRRMRIISYAQHPRSSLTHGGFRPLTLKEARIPAAYRATDESMVFRPATWSAPGSL